MFHVSCFNQMYKIIEKTNKYTWAYEYFNTY